MAFKREALISGGLITAKKKSFKTSDIPVPVKILLEFTCFLRDCLQGGRKILEGGTTLPAGFTCRNFGPSGVQVENAREGIKNGGRQKQKCNLGP